MKNYNPNIHHRRSMRLKGYDYARAGLYFITICCQNRIHRFGHVENGNMVLNEFGQIAHDEWLKLPQRFPNFSLDVFQIMPDHMHGIIALSAATAAGATLAVAPTISDIVGSYKSIVANECLKIYKSKNEIMGKLWQRNYHDRIIRNTQSYHRISKYIIDNPAKWTEKKSNKK
jgi:REP element-mobilizing transposase RayT